LTALRNDSNFA